MFTSRRIGPTPEQVLHVIEGELKTAPSWDRIGQLLDAMKELNGFAHFGVADAWELFTKKLGIDRNHRHYDDIRVRYLQAATPPANPDSVKGRVSNVTNAPESQARVMARLKRDRPDIAEAWARGEYDSARAAAMAAGFGRERAKRDPYLPMDAMKAAEKLRETFGDEWCDELGEALRDMN